MKRLAVGLFALMLLASTSLGQSVKLPATVSGDPGAWIVVVPESKDGGDVKFKVGPGLTLVPIDKLFPGQKAAGVVVQGKAGTYEVWAWNAKGDVASEIAVCKIVIGDVPPDPGPNPPTPPPPVPASVKRVLIVYETSETSKLPEKQQQILYGKTVRDYLNSHCEADADGKTKAWRIYDKDVDTAAESKHWQDVMKVEKKSVPWLIIGDGKTGYSGPLPATVEDFLTLARKHLGD